MKVALALYHLGMFYRHNKDFSEAQAKGRQAVAVARTCSDPKTLAVCLLDAAKSFNAAGRPTPEAIPLLREAMHLRRRVVPHLLALLDGTRLLVKALEGLASEGRQDEAKAILEEELKEAPIDADLLRLTD